MAELVAVRHESQKDDEDPGLMSREYFDRFGKDKGYVEVKDKAAQAAAASASGEDPGAAPDAAAARRGRS